MQTDPEPAALLRTQTGHKVPPSYAFFPSLCWEHFLHFLSGKLVLDFEDGLEMPFPFYSVSSVPLHLSSHTTPLLLSPWPFLN